MPEISVDANLVIDSLQQQIAEGARTRAILDAQVLLLRRENEELRQKIGEQKDD